ncbi:tetratricopeptide repeat protein [Rhizobium ruizarguesonis]|jgi:Flp pilus assembly protein TadD|uniref:Tetratricopeptide repeat protein n=1 Tax=Rhizobium ruizarguesonis TaxID=2081791 RepID=A0ABY1XFU3_9HYPH|nr:tetratricopeptide repeat protein [Rhizobium ruizarguesonis]TAU78860.1 tetratricopeptide repeat protein [Rhizobium ruizarguesonis]TAV35273.1 tetratricopeptide repeat protein [Rhizobium ruizarguesonis]TAV40157.1 tetratricopeptide repeat protein [Rhizobium ruizarguesonis]TAW01404.1 tetratricopeptide repeat protein [Rhizobium ruizarguesonis]TAW18851.1 tetratricopeptide repeat protein [Rhizobium ruizarguesonis]
MPASLTTIFTNRILQGAAASLIVLALAGCSTTKDRMTTGSVPKLTKPVEEMDATELRSATDRLGQAYEKNPRDPVTGVNYANLLRMNGRDTQALAVMQQVAIANPGDRNVLAAYGKAQAAAGQFQQALDTIGRAQTPDRPDWKLISAQGAILDQMGRASDARQRYRDALDIQPNEPSILSNLGMSYVLTGDLRTAETYLRSAASQPTADSRVRQNLALVVGLQGRFPEAEQIARRELSPQQADANVAYLRGMLSQQNSWQKLAAKDKTPGAADGSNTN